MSDQEPKTLTDLERELAELDQQAATLQAEHAAILAQVVTATNGKSAELAQKFSLVSARLAALPIMRAGLEGDLETLRKRQAINEYATLCEVVQQNQIEIDNIDAQIEKAQALVNDLVVLRSAKESENLTQNGRRLNKARALQETLTPDELAAINKRFEYVPRRYRRDKVIS